MPDLRTLLGTALVALALTLPTAEAADSLEFRYSLNLRGLPAGEMVLRHEENGERYRSELSGRSGGIAGLFGSYRSTAISQGRVAPENGLQARSYHWVSQRSHRLWVTDIVFDQDTGDVVDLSLRRNNDPRGTEEPPELQTGVLDPVAAVVELRRLTAEALAGGPQRYAVNVFDGRRRYDVEAELIGRTTATVDRRPEPVVEVRLTFRPLAGLDESDLSRLPGDDGYAIAYLSDDDQLVPLRVETRGAPVETLLRLVEYCAGAGCALTN